MLSVKREGSRNPSRRNAHSAARMRCTADRYGLAAAALHGGPGHRTDRCQIAIKLRLRYDTIRCKMRAQEWQRHDTPSSHSDRQVETKMANSPSCSVSMRRLRGTHTHTRTQRLRYGGGIGRISLSRPTTCGVQGRAYYPIFTIFSSLWWWWWWRWWCPRGVGDRFESLQQAPRA